MTEQPLPPLLVPPEDRVDLGVQRHAAVPLALLLPVVDVQDVLVLARLGLDQRRAGTADGLVALQRREQVLPFAMGCQTLPQGGRVLGRLRRPLREVGQHGVARVAEQTGLSGRMDPGREAGEVAETPLQESAGEPAELLDARFPGAEAPAEFLARALHDPGLVGRLAVRGGADDDVVELAVADGVADEVGLRAAPGGVGRVGDQAGQVGVGEEVFAWDQDAVGDVAGVSRAIGLAGQEGAGGGFDSWTDIYISAVSSLKSIYPGDTHHPRRQSDPPPTSPHPPSSRWAPRNHTGRHSAPYGSRRRPSSRRPAAPRADRPGGPGSTGRRGRRRCRRRQRW